MGPGNLEWTLAAGRNDFLILFILRLSLEDRLIRFQSSLYEQTKWPLHTVVYLGIEEVR